VTRSRNCQFESFGRFHIVSLRWTTDYSVLSDIWAGHERSKRLKDWSFVNRTVGGLQADRGFRQSPMDGDSSYHFRHVRWWHTRFMMPPIICCNSEAIHPEHPRSNEVWNICRFRNEQIYPSEERNPDRLQLDKYNVRVNFDRLHYSPISFLISEHDMRAWVPGSGQLFRTYSWRFRCEKSRNRFHSGKINARPTGFDRKSKSQSEIFEQSSIGRRRRVMSRRRRTPRTSDIGVFNGRRSAPGKSHPIIM
jgi:hypothetical protein